MIRTRDENQKLRATKRKWTYEEDQLLCQGYEMYGTKEWKISQNMLEQETESNAEKDI